MQIERIQSATELTVFHLRAARATLKLSLKELSKLSTISERALLRLEKGTLDEAPQNSSLVTMGKVRAIYEENGIEFYRNNFIHLASQENRFTVRILKK